MVWEKATSGYSWYSSKSSSDMSDQNRGVGSATCGNILIEMNYNSDVGSATCGSIIIEMNYNSDVGSATCGAHGCEAGGRDLESRINPWSFLPSILGLLTRHIGQLLLRPSHGPMQPMWNTCPHLRVSTDSHKHV